MSPEGAAQSWWVKTNEKVYGPYSREQMSRFLGEGRVTATTLVSTRPTGDWTETRHCRVFNAALEEARGAFRTAREAKADVAEANILVWADMISGSLRRLEHELRQLGAVAQVTPGLYIVRTTRTAGTLRNALSQILERGDKLLVLDSSRDRLAWFNLGPETDAHIREVWNAPNPHVPEPA